MIVFLCEEIWSMGKNKGVSSLSRLISNITQTNDVEIFTPEINFKSFNNKYIDYIMNGVFYVWVNIKYIIGVLSLNKVPSVIYVSSSLPSPAGKILSMYYSCPYVQRLYGTFLNNKLGNLFEMVKSYQEVLGFSLNATKYVITDDGTYGDKVADYFNISEDKLLFLVNGVDKLDFSRKNKERKKLCDMYSVPYDAFIIVSVSRFATWKRVDRIIRAVNALKYERDIYYFVLGDGPMDSFYRSIADNDNIIFTGAKENREVSEYMLAADAFVSAYDLTNLGNPLLEAMSAGLAIITINNGETAKVFNGTNMLLVEPEEIEDKMVENIRNKIIEIKNNINKRAELQLSARKYAESNILSWEERINIEALAIKELIAK